MFLTSDAFRPVGAAQRRQWDWRSTPILFVSCEWDPDHHGAEALAGRKLVKTLLDAGACVHVLAAARAAEEFDAAGYEVTSVPSPPFPRNKVRRALQMMRTRIPESAGAWAAGAIRAGLDVLGSLPAHTLIYGRAMPCTSNVVAWHLARRRRLAWVAHFSDEWPPLSHGTAWRTPYKWPLYRIWRRRILRDAGALTFTNPLQAEDILRGHENCLEKAFVVSHLASEDRPQSRPPQYDVFHIVHTGSVYLGRSAASLAAGLRRFLDRTPAARGRVRLTQAGWSAGDLQEWSERYALGDVVAIEGQLRQDQLAALTESASLFVTIDLARPVSTTMPSKIPEYLNARRPILAITAPGTALGRLFRDDGAGLTAQYDSPEDVANALGQVFEAWQQRRLDSLLPHQTAVESFERRRVLAELGAAFEMARRSLAATARSAGSPVALRREPAE